MKVIPTMLIIGLLLLIGYGFYTRVSFDNYKAQKPCISSESFNPVIFLPGLKGSLLEKNGNSVWLKFRHVLRNTEPLIYEGTLKATGVFRGIGPYRAYDKITTKLACQKNGYIYWYDWRDYPEKNAKGFGELVERVTQETGKKPNIIAHSMGGLIAHGYLKDNPDKINKVVYVSVPFIPGVGYFDDVNEGTSVGLNKKLMSREALISHPASYLLMPHFGSNMYAGVELMEAKTWKDHRFGIYRDGDFDTDRLQGMMDEVKKYHKKLDTPMKLQNDILFITSECHTTVLTIDENGKRSYVPGDGRVSQISSFPPDEMPNQRNAVICQKHDKQMNDKRILKTIFDFLQ